MARKKNSNSEDLELDQMARAELARLQRQYRIMEGDREAYSEEVKTLLQKQRKMIEILENEKVELLANLNCAKCRAKETTSGKNAAKLKQLFLLHDKLNKEIIHGKSQIKELEFQIDKVEKELETTKQKLGLKASIREEVDDQTRTQQQLENRLDVATIKLNKLLANNHKLREEIDHFLKERTSFNHLFQELTNSLKSGKKIIMNLMEQSTIAYEQRKYSHVAYLQLLSFLSSHMPSEDLTVVQQNLNKEAQTKLEALKQKGKQDVLIYNQEAKELQRKLDHDSKLHEFLGIKGQKRIMTDLEAKEAFNKQQQKEALENQIQTYQLLLEQIQKISDEADVDRLAAQFVKQEEENFALFNYVNELNNELEVLQEQVDNIKNNMEEQRKINEAKALQKQAALEILQAELEERKLETKGAEEKLEKCQKASETLFRRIQFVFELIRSDTNPVLQLLGENAVVTTFNSSLYLGIIEKRTKELIKLFQNWKVIKKEQKSEKPAAAHSFQL